MTPHRLTTLTALTATALVLSACTSITGANVDTKSEADTTAAVQQYADQISAAVGGPLTNAATNAAPCTGKLAETHSDVYTVQGTYRIAVPAEQHVATAARLRDTWKANGWKITDDRTFNNTEAVVTAETPDGFNVNVESTKSGANIAIMVNSPCYKSPTPR
jgi:hypothetical protein